MISVALISIDHLDQFGTASAAQNGRPVRRQGGFVDIKFIRVDRALHHAFAQPPGRGDEHHPFKSGFGVAGEHHAAGAEVAAHHLLNSDRQGDFGVVKPLVDAIGDGAIIEQRSEYFADAGEHRVDTVDVEEGILLAGKRGFGQIFGGGRGAHRHGGIGRAAQLAPGLADFFFNAGGKRGVADPFANLPACLPQFDHIIDIEVIQQRLNALIQPLKPDEFAVRLRAGGKAIGDIDAGLGKVGNHLPEGRIFAANARHIPHAEIGKP